MRLYQLAHTPFYLALVLFYQRELLYPQLILDLGNALPRMLVVLCKQPFVVFIRIPARQNAHNGLILRVADVFQPPLLHQLVDQPLLGLRHKHVHSAAAGNFNELL